MVRTEPSIGRTDELGIKDDVVLGEIQTADDEQIVAAAQSPKENSQTSPQLNAIFRRMLLAKKWLAFRQDAYNNAVKTLYLGKKAPDPKQVESVAAQHFQFERQQLADIARNISKAGVHDEAGASMENVLHSQLPPESIAALSYFSDNFEQYVQKEHPQFFADFEHSIAERSTQLFPGKNEISVSVQRAAAVESLFKKEFPGLSDELAQKAAVDGPHSHYAKALSLLKWTSVAVNPSGALISYAVGAIMKTEAMSPLRKLIGDAVHHSQKVLLKPAAKKIMGFLPEKHAGKIMSGMAMAGVAALYVTGVFNEDDVRQVAANVADFVGNAAEVLDEKATNAFVSASELAGNMKEATLSSLSLNDAVTLDAPSTPAEKQMAEMLSMPDAPEISPQMAEMLSMPDEPEISPQMAEMLSMPDAPEISPQMAEMLSMPDEFVSQYSPSASQQMEEMLNMPDEFVSQYADPAKVDGVPDKLNNLTTEPATIDDVLRDLNGVQNESSAVSQPVPAGVDVAYGVKAGDCLSRIAEEHLKSTGVPYNYNVISAYVEQIAAANNIENIHKIQVGETLQIPQFGAEPPVVESLSVQPEQPQLSAQATPVRHDVQVGIGALHQDIPGAGWENLVPPLIELPIAEDLLVPVHTNTPAPDTIAASPGRMKPGF